MDHVDRILAQWAQERPDLDTGAMAIFGRLKRLHDLLSERLNEVFAAHDLTAASFDVLATLRRAGPPYSLAPSALVGWTMVTSGTMTHRLDRLEAAGLVMRKVNPNDGRGQVISLTPKGLALIDRVVTDHVANQNRLVSGLSPASRDALDRALREWLTEISTAE